MVDENRKTKKEENEVKSMKGILLMKRKEDAEEAKMVKK